MGNVKTNIQHVTQSLYAKLKGAINSQMIFVIFV